MSKTSAGQHGAGGPPVRDDIPQPTFAERARTLMHLGRIASLSTQSEKQPGFPFGSVMPYGLDGRGRPVFLISTMAMHTQNLRRDQRAALLVTQGGDEGDVLGQSRVTLIGGVVPVSDEERPAVKDIYLAAYENAKYWVDFDDFFFYRMDVVDLYFVGGFGVMGWVSAQDYAAAEPDPLADDAERIISHMNGDHADSLVLLCRAHTEFDPAEARMTAVDRLGFHVRMKIAEGMKGARIAFGREVRDSREARETLVEMVNKAKADATS